MIQRALYRDQKPGRMLLLSLFLHLVAVLAFSYHGLFKPVLHEAAPYYVDIVSLPAIAPAPMNPESPQAVVPVAPAAAVKTQAPPARAEMTLPAKKTPPPLPAAVTSQDGNDQEAREFAQKMSRLEYKSESRHQEEALAQLQKKVAAGQGAGGATAMGRDKGADYGAYIQSRLKDALASTIVYRSKAPEAAVHLYIDKKGKLVRYVMERPSADKLFNDSVIRTIEKAKVNFPATPTAAGFDKLYVFSPQEVNK